MESAIEVKTSANSIRSAARVLSITISQRNIKIGAGIPIVLTYTEEREIVLSLVHVALGEMRFGLTKDLVDIIDFLL